MKGDEEFEALKEQRDLREAGQPNQKSACLVAVCPAESMQVGRSSSTLMALVHGAACDWRTKLTLICSRPGASPFDSLPCAGCSGCVEPPDDWR